MKIFWGREFSFYMSKNLAMNLDGFIHGVMTKKTSAVFLFDGRSGQGKTTISSQVGCYISKKVKEYYENHPGLGEPPEFTLDCMTWTPDDFIARFEKAKKGEIVILDESMIISNRSTMSELNRKIIIMMSMIRSKQLFVFFNVNSLFDLDKNLPLHRADMLITVYPREKSFASRGAYMVTPAAGGKLKHLYITGKKFYDYSKARPAFTDTFPAFFPFSEEEYERRKQEAINNYFESKGKPDRNIAMESRDKYIRYILEHLPTMRQEECARIGGISLRTVQYALQRTRGID